MKMHATESFDIRAPGAMAAVAPDQPRKLFAAHSIVMNRGGAAAMDFYRLGPAGPAIMVTGQLSGCSFVMIPGGPGQVDVAHVEPRHRQFDPAGLGRRQTGEALHADLSKAMSNAEIYGASGKSKNYDSDDRTASVLGVRVGGQWKIFAQKHDSLAGDYRIKSVYQIYPTRKKV